MTTLLIPARWVLGFYLLIENLLPFIVVGSAGGVAHGAHIGGFLAGLGLVYVLGHMPLPEGLHKSASLTVEKICSPKLIPQAVAAGELDVASRCYLEFEKSAERKAVAPETVLALGDYLLEKGDQQSALKVFRRFIAERQGSPGLDRAYLATGQLLLHQPRHAISAYQYLLSALELATTPAISAAARVGIRHIEDMQRRSGGSLIS
jgi:hypothetical protein